MAKDLGLNLKAIHIPYFLYSYVYELVCNMFSLLRNSLGIVINESVHSFTELFDKFDQSLPSCLLSQTV